MTAPSTVPVLAEQNNPSWGSLGFIFEMRILHVGGEPACVIRWVSECKCLEERGNEGRKIETQIETVCGVYYGLCVSVYTCSWVKCLLSLRTSCVWLCVGLSCAFVYCCVLSSLPAYCLFQRGHCCLTEKYARAPPQSFIGSYCHLTQIQYVTIDCVEMQSGSPQQRSKQSKFNKTPLPAFSPALIAPSKGEQMYLCVQREIEDLSRGHSYC